MSILVISEDPTKARRGVECPVPDKHPPLEAVVGEEGKRFSSGTLILVWTNATSSRCLEYTTQLQHTDSTLRMSIHSPGQEKIYFHRFIM